MTYCYRIFVRSYYERTRGHFRWNTSFRHLSRFINARNNRIRNSEKTVCMKTDTPVVIKNIDPVYGLWKPWTPIQRSWPLLLLHDNLFFLRKRANFSAFICHPFCQSGHRFVFVMKYKWKTDGVHDVCVENSKDWTTGKTYALWPLCFETCVEESIYDYEKTDKNV